MSTEKPSDPSLGENSDPSVPDPIQLTEEQVQNIEYINSLCDEPLTNYAKIRTFSKGCDLIHFFQSSTDLACERWAFRGQCNTEWGLTSSLDRLARSRKTCSSHAEQYLLTTFKRRAHHYLRDLPGEHDELEWLALMQHHGAPTSP